MESKIAPPQKTAGEERNQKDNAIQPLSRRAGQVDLVAKPMDIDEWCRQLEEKIFETVIQAKWPKSQHCYAPCYDAMDQIEWSQDLDVDQRDHEVPEEVTGRQPLHHPPGTRVAVHAVFPGLADPVGIIYDDIERYAADDDALDEGREMNVPVDFGALREVVVVPWVEPPGQSG